MKRLFENVQRKLSSSSLHNSNLNIRRRSLSSINSLQIKVLRGGYNIDLQNVDNSFTKLHKAVYLNSSDRVQKYLSKYGVNSKDIYNRTPLHYAAVNGNVAIINMLISARANVNVQDSDGRTPLIKAIECGHNEIVAMLMEHGANVDISDYGNGNTALHHCLLNANLQSALYIIRNALIIDYNKRNHRKETFLHIAAKIADLYCVLEELIANGIEIEAKDELGRTAADVAKLHNNHDSYQLITRYMNAAKHQQNSEHDMDNIDSISHDKPFDQHDSSSSSSIIYDNIPDTKQAPPHSASSRRRSSNTSNKLLNVGSLDVNFRKHYRFSGYFEDTIEEQTQQQTEPRIDEAECKEQQESNNESNSEQTVEWTGSMVPITPNNNQPELILSSDEMSDLDEMIRKDLNTDIIIQMDNNQISYSPSFTNSSQNSTQFVSTKQSFSIDNHQHNNNNIDKREPIEEKSTDSITTNRVKSNQNEEINCHDEFGLNQVNDNNNNNNKLESTRTPDQMETTSNRQAVSSVSPSKSYAQVVASPPKEQQLNNSHWVKLNQNENKSNKSANISQSPNSAKQSPQGRHGRYLVKNKPTVDNDNCTVTLTSESNMQTSFASKAANNNQNQNPNQKSNSINLSERPNSSSNRRSSSIRTTVRPNNRHNPSGLQVSSEYHWKGNQHCKLLNNDKLSHENVCQQQRLQSLNGKHTSTSTNNSPVLNNIRQQVQLTNGLDENSQIAFNDELAITANDSKTSVQEGHKWPKHHSKRRMNKMAKKYGNHQSGGEGASMASTSTSCSSSSTSPNSWSPVKKCVTVQHAQVQTNLPVQSICNATDHNNNKYISLVNTLKQTLESTGDSVIGPIEQSTNNNKHDETTIWLVKSIRKLIGQTKQNRLELDKKNQEIIDLKQQIQQHHKQQLLLQEQTTTSSNDELGLGQDAQTTRTAIDQNANNVLLVDILKQQHELKMKHYEAIVQEQLQENFALKKQCHFLKELIQLYEKSNGINNNEQANSQRLSSSLDGQHNCLMLNTGQQLTSLFNKLDDKLALMNQFNQQPFSNIDDEIRLRCSFIQQLQDQLTHLKWFTSPMPLDHSHSGRVGQSGPGFTNSTGDSHIHHQHPIDDKHELGHCQQASNKKQTFQPNASSPSPCNHKHSQYKQLSGNRKSLSLLDLSTLEADDRGDQQDGQHTRQPVKEAYNERAYHTTGRTTPPKCKTDANIDYSNSFSYKSKYFQSKINELRKQLGYVNR